jgi:hypothetical protein
VVLYGVEEKRGDNIPRASLAVKHRSF